MIIFKVVKNWQTTDSEDYVQYINQHDVHYCVSREIAEEKIKIELKNMLKHLDTHVDWFDFESDPYDLKINYDYYDRDHDWCDESHESIINKMRHDIKNNQLEFMSGTFSSILKKPTHKQEIYFIEEVFVHEA